MKKVISLILQISLLTGCVSVEVNDSNKEYCYRYVDYKNEEHIMTYDDNNCYFSSGQIICKNNELYVRVMEFEKIECSEEE